MQVFQGLLNAIGFLTILPIRRGEITSLTIGFFPLVGLIIGGSLFLLNFALSGFFPKEITIAIILVFYFIITGGLHLDGFADTVDGLCSGQDKEGILKVMDKGNIGTFAVIALFFLLLLKFLFLTLLPDETILLLPLIGRGAMVSSIAISKPAKGDGLGKMFINTCGIKGGILATIFTLIVAFLLFEIQGLILIFCIFLVTIIITKALIRKIGGMTGDTFGAISEIDELVYLLVLFLFQL